VLLLIFHTSAQVSAHTGPIACEVYKNNDKMNDNGFKKKIFRGFDRDVNIIDSFNMMAEELRFLTGHNQVGTENYLSYVKRTWIGFDDANGYHPPLFNPCYLIV
uniref:Uncharacterized protein n=1 Tax=Acrobeloides nanus TaxID=290746 RepID=A0A914DAD9_9BILA